MWDACQSECAAAEGQRARPGVLRGPFGDRPTQMRQEASCVRLLEEAELSPDSLTSVTCAQCEQGVRCFTPHSQSVCLAVWTETGTGPPPPLPRGSFWALAVVLVVLLQGCGCATISSTFPGVAPPHLPYTRWLK